MKVDLEVIRDLVRKEVDYLEREQEKLDDKIKALAKACGKQISWSPQFEVTDIETKDDEA